MMTMAMMVLSSCDAWLDVKPYDKMSQDDLLSTESGFIKNLNGIYIELNSDMLSFKYCYILFLLNVFTLENLREYHECLKSA